MKSHLSLILLAAVCRATCSNAASPAEGIYNIGLGRNDITGPAAGVNMMGYVDPEQINAGIHTRLYSRAFIIDDGTNRFVYVNADIAMGTQLVKMTVIERLKARFGDVYTTGNVILSATHTHSAPAGYLQYFAYQFSSLGFIEEAFEAIVQGVVESITIAHNSMTTGRLYFSVGELTDASINRSPSAYANNPAEERARYKYDTDKDMILLKFVAEDGTDLGMINWFAVHPTSMNKTNYLISGDHKGYAEMLFEKAMDPTSLSGQSSFVGAFAQSNCGDVSPNTDGAKCQDTGEPCDYLTSTCEGRASSCYALGPGKDMEESTKIIGAKQFKKAFELYNDPDNVKLVGPVRMISQQLDMSNYSIQLVDGNLVQTCAPALGFSVAAGTTDGTGSLDFTQGMTEDNPLWTKVANFFGRASEDQIACHHPKPILFNTKNYDLPYEWTGDIVETQIARVGQLVIAAVPGEFTTMAGRRFRDQLSTVFVEDGAPDLVLLIAGLSNAYSHYTTTPEEYAVQRYEGASTLYGPHTLAAYLHHYSRLAKALVRGETVGAGPAPPNLRDRQISLLPRNRYDSPDIGRGFGDVLVPPPSVVHSGDTVTVKFVSAHPINSVQHGGSFLTVEKEKEEGNWEVIATDADWETKFSWQRTSKLLGTSVATIKWDVAQQIKNGTFRISHAGHAKHKSGKLTTFSGVTKPFLVASPGARFVGRQRDQPRQKPNIVRSFFLHLKRLFSQLL